VAADGPLHLEDADQAEDDHDADGGCLLGRPGLQLADEEQPHHDEADDDVGQIRHVNSSHAA
jgi:hypothetical protein